MLPPQRFAPPPIVPPGEVASAEHLMAIAHRLERNGARRYRELAARMRGHGDTALAKLFAVLATVEEKHAREVDARAIGLLGHTPNPEAVAWDLPDNFDEEDARSAGLSPYRALALAVRSEERAFAFYSYIAAYAAPELRTASAEA